MHTAPPQIYTLSLHDALPISTTEISSLKKYMPPWMGLWLAVFPTVETIIAQLIAGVLVRSEEHTSELQSRRDLVCRLLLEKKNKRRKTIKRTYLRFAYRTSST